MSVHVLLTSDTHLDSGARLPDDLLRLAERADHVLHCGDCTSGDVLDTLAALAPLTAVLGNIDDRELVGRLEERATLELGGVRIGMVHDPGPVDGRHARLAAYLPDCAIRCYGHTHMPELTQVEDGSWVINPGSPTQRRRAPTHTACWLELADGVVVAADLVELP